MSSFDRDGTVAIIRDYYHFLTKMYLDESQIVEPPPGGWPNITPETMRPLGKTDVVVDLLRHLPYVKSSGDDGPRVAPYVRSAEWPDLANSLTREAEPWGILVCTDGWDSSDSNTCDIHGGPVPPYCVGLTFARKYDTVLLLDTEWSCVWWIDCPDEIESSRHWRITQEERDDANVPIIVEDDGAYSKADALQLSDDEGNESRTSSESPPTSDDEDQGDLEDGFVQDDEDPNSDGVEDGEDEADDDDDDDDGRPEWMQDSWHPQWLIPEFFEKMKRHFQQLDFVPKDSKEVLEGWPQDIRDNTEFRLADKLKPIYRKHGWPNLEEYRKEDCLKEVRTTVR
ncbi:hypothetical protein E8E12_007859 [Didymella heteroderae]|uniref:Uncharacterized protein n=1 Tax=Didymella heteroderae TaxID=1769908 RepID=A0A9P4WR34_9PLEO|nr:hypothetical protein E8E12_007859 [Didymella heteroderae]